jgi:hypothetical protein
MLPLHQAPPPDIERKLALSLSARNLPILQAAFDVRMAGDFIGIASTGKLPFRTNREYLEISPSSAIVEEQYYAAHYAFASGTLNNPGCGLPSGYGVRAIARYSVRCGSRPPRPHAKESASETRQSHHRRRCEAGDSVESLCSWLA